MYQNQYQQGGYGQPQSQNQNTYVGSAKFQNGQYGLMVSVSLNAEDIAKLQASLNENGWVTFSLRERQQPSQSGATHYGVIRPPMPPQQGNANWNGGNGGYGGNGGRGNYGQGQYQADHQKQYPYRQEHHAHDAVLGPSRIDFLTLHHHDRSSFSLIVILSPRGASATALWRL